MSAKRASLISHTTLHHIDFFFSTSVQGRRKYLHLWKSNINTSAKKLIQLEFCSEVVIFFCTCPLRESGSSMKRIIYLALDRTAGGKDKFMNTAGFNDRVPAAKAGTPSTQNCSPIRFAYWICCRPHKFTP